MNSSSQLTQTLRNFMDVAMQRSMHERSQFAKATGLSMPQFGILMQIHFHGNCGISDISNRFEITSAAASQLVDKLVQSGLIQRAEDPHDRRAKLLNITEKGKELIQQGTQRRYLWLEDLARKLSPEEREQVNEALQIMTRAAQELETETVHASASIPK
jgi:DNA-binding MarR family transcriptional regulator